MIIIIRQALDTDLGKANKIMKGTLNTNAQAVLNVVKDAYNHPTASDVYEAVRVTRPRMGLASVYRILHMLVEQGWLREIQHNDETCRYDARTDRHDHAICKTCGKLIDVPVGVNIPQDLLESAAKAAGIAFSSYELLLYGICSACSQNGGQDRLPPPRELVPTQ
jgi:Fur family peroxide stress response transcriptional regulator